MVTQLCPIFLRLVVSWLNRETGTYEHSEVEAWGLCDDGQVWPMVLHNQAGLQALCDVDGFDAVLEYIPVTGESNG